MTKVYFVRHAQPDHAWEDDRTRPLTVEGRKDSRKVLEFLQDKNIDSFYCSPYKRSMDTIEEAAAYYEKEVITDERLRERESGRNGNHYDTGFNCDSFLRILDWMPYIIELDFENGTCTDKIEHLHIEKEFMEK
ncbi:phosphoglycerate mutase family protein [Lacrimispora sp. BS-2]|uniref:Phosphoglycerate mutase family protein n=1 Tax=Lacrimispora sp. BS-2 TaxID=3151850 RepID=A0AAU7PM86_9FIRM